jgi:hypothetical protein
MDGPRTEAKSILPEWKNFRSSVIVATLPQDVPSHLGLKGILIQGKGETQTLRLNMMNISEQDITST